MSVNGSPRPPKSKLSTPAFVALLVSWGVTGIGAFIGLVGHSILFYRLLPFLALAAFGILTWQLIKLYKEDQAKLRQWEKDQENEAALQRLERMSSQSDATFLDLNQREHQP
jgi:bacteriorhodopsin